MHIGFHSLKAKEYLNEEVRNTDVYCTTNCNCYDGCDCFLNGYLGLLSSKFDGAFTINSYLVMAVITKQQSKMCKTLFRKVLHIHVWLQYL